MFLLYLHNCTNATLPMTLLFHITNLLLGFTSLVVLIIFVATGRNVANASFLFRRRIFIGLFISLLFCVFTAPLMFHGDDIEVFCSIPMCMLYFASIGFMVLSTAYFGRKYYRNVFIWFVLLQYGAVLLFLSILSRFAGYYTPMFSFFDFLYLHGNFLIYGRIFLLAIMVSVWLMMICVVIDSYVRCLKQDVYEQSSELLLLRLRTADNISTLTYIVVLSATMLSYMLPSVEFHVVCNVLLTIAIVRSFFLYEKHKKDILNWRNDNPVFVVIRQKVTAILEDEAHCPLFKSNVSIEAIAYALQVSRDDLSSYIYNELGMTFAAWLSEKKLLHCASQIAGTDRKISDIAYSAGYSDLPAMSKAFKKRFGLSPSEYRRSYGGTAANGPSPD